MSVPWMVYFHALDGRIYANTAAPQLPINAVRSALERHRYVGIPSDTELIKVEIIEMEKVIASWSMKELQAGLQLSNPPASHEALSPFQSTVHTHTWHLDWHDAPDYCEICGIGEAHWRAAGAVPGLQELATEMLARFPLSKMESL